MAETCAQLQTRLDGYITARDKLAMGKGVVQVGDGDKRIQYGPTDGKRLDQLINEVRLLMTRQRCAGCGRGGMIHITPSG